MYGLPVTGTSTAITRFLGLLLVLEPPQPAASTATPARRIASRRTTGSLQSRGPEIRLLDDAARGDLGGGAFRDDGAGAEHEDAVCHAPDEPQAVLDDEHGDPALADPLDGRGDRVQLVRSRARGELVHEHHLRLGRERGG